MSHRQDKERRRAQWAAAVDERAGRRRERAWAGAMAAAAVAVAVAVVIATSGGGTASTPAGAVAAETSGAGAVVDGSVTDRLKALRGRPVVVNQWASWCPNWVQEFPFFQRLSARYRRRVAFLGLDSQDNRAGAEAFLRRFPVDYPSIYDRDAAQARSLGGGQGWPTTFFYDRSGRQTYVREGGYVTAASLERDIRRYALGRPA